MPKKYIIQVSESYHPEYMYDAVFDGYDGSPEADHPIGVGDTHIEAIKDLVLNSWA